MRRGRLLSSVVAAGLVGSQAGHLLAYQLRFGIEAGRLQSAGVHSYFPSVAKTGLGLASLALVAGLLVVGIARVIAGRPVPGGSAPSFVRLLAAMYTLQLALFAVQETAEAALGGSRTGSATLLLLWGALGQLPVAIAASVAVRWLLVRVRPAFAVLRLRPQALRLIVASVLVEAWPNMLAPATVEVVNSSYVRGPPSL